MRLQVANSCDLLISASKYCLPILLTVFFVGCGSDGPQRLALHGDVDWQGEDVAAGSITFVPIDGNSGLSASSAVTNGSYAFNADNGPIAGSNRVIITFVPSKGAAMFQQKAAQKKGENNSTTDPLMNYEDPEAMIGLGEDDDPDAPKPTRQPPSPTTTSPTESSPERRGNAWRFNVDLSKKDSLRKDFTLQ